MSENLAFVNGELVPADRALVPVQDAGFMQGVTVAEQMRTIGGKLFRLDAHIARLERSLDIVGVSLSFSLDDLKAAAQQLAQHNHSLLAPGDDLGLSMFATPGLYPTFAGAKQSEPFVCMHTYPVAFQLFAEKYESGQSLVVPQFRQVPPQCWPAELKCRSRMHYYLADREAKRIDPGARALLLDMDGNISEASTASVFIYLKERGLVAPPEEKILPGISLSVVKDLAQNLKVPFEHCDLTLDELTAADEVMLCSTSPCLLPVVRINQQRVRDGSPGPIYRQLLDAWMTLVEVDLISQAKQFASR